MRLKDKPLSFVVNFLLGVSWATAFLGVITSFLSFYHENLLWALLSAFVGALPGMVAILLLEHFITSKEKHLELQTQTDLLKKLLKQKDNNDLQ